RRCAMTAGSFPAREAVRRRGVGFADIVVSLGMILLFVLVAKLSADSRAHFSPPKTVPHISLDPRNLPSYAARSRRRMFIALFFSLVFALAYGYAAAKLRRARVVLLPLLDILQSVPVLGFLSITVTVFVDLFPGSLLGLEATSIFAA